MGEKRSRDEQPELRVSSVTTDPTLAVTSFFKGFSVPEDAHFDLYKNKNDEVIFHGENDRLEYDSITNNDDPSDYAIALYDPVNKSVELYKAPVLLGNVTSKAHKRLRGPKVKQNNVRANIQRTALGEAFGTKKAKKAITDLERNRIDAEKLVSAEADIIDTVKGHTTSLPTRQELEKTVLDDRPTPVADVSATSVEDIYPIDNIIPKKEQQFIRAGPIIKEKDLEKRLEYMPYQESEFIKKQLAGITDDSQTSKLQLIYYASLLMGVYHNRRISNKLALTTQLNSPPEVLIDGIIDRFAIQRPGQFGRSKDRGFKIDPHHEDKLLCFLLATIMHISGFHVEVVPLAQELSLKPTRLIGLFKALGAIVKSATVAEAEAFGIKKNLASTYKVASLKVPFKLPQMTRGGRRN
ncbi:CYFA0S06e02872g1_1 [Cyberlindnera fabianii]|uniref:CYFA0S06e02872g1_1 n=1 Tax=Cyberlindnera fabianii TaxID=36022 RepID=A0A061AUB7_CYBFA|nr:DNA-directed RNA polymerase I subunit RPA49 [Cyberlindnera fabianii]CDR41159.1 CYFA0S06e02872g1_1 [Cyberlindnera fabianii]